MHHHACLIRSESIFHIQCSITGEAKNEPIPRVTEASAPVLSWTGPALQALTLPWTISSELSVGYTTHGGHCGCKATWQSFADLSVFLRLGLQECHNVLEGT